MVTLSKLITAVKINFTPKAENAMHNAITKKKS